MNLIRQHPVILLAVVIALFAAINLARFAGDGDHVAQQAYYLDVQTGALFTNDVTDLPPIAAPSGGEGVLAHVFSCSACDDPERRRVGYVEKYSDAGKIWLRDRPVDEFATNPGHYVGAVDDKGDIRWVDAAGNAGNDVIIRANTHCPGQRVDCRP